MSTLLHDSFDTSTAEQKAGPAERALSVVSGSLLLLPLAGKRSAWRWTAAAAGGALIFTGLSGTRTASRLVSNKLPTVERLRQSITIGKDAQELHRLWRDPDAMTRIIHPLGEVTPFGSEHVRWCIRFPFGKLESEAVLAEDIPGKVVHWKSGPGSRVQIDEYMHFSAAPHGLGTVASLEYEIDFSPIPAGEAVRYLTTLVEQAPRSAIRKVLHNYKSLAETGEIPTLERNPSARSGRNGHKGDLV